MMSLTSSFPFYGFLLKAISVQSNLNLGYLTVEFNWLLLHKILSYIVKGK